jgi:hypothetical protein
VPTAADLFYTNRKRRRQATPQPVPRAAFGNTPDANHRPDSRRSGARADSPRFDSRRARCGGRYGGGIRRPCAAGWGRGCPTGVRVRRRGQGDTRTLTPRQLQPYTLMNILIIIRRSGSVGGRYVLQQNKIPELRYPRNVKSKIKVLVCTVKSYISFVLFPFNKI